MRKSIEDSDLLYFPASVLLKPDAIKITDYHRMIVTRYYAKLLHRFGTPALLRRLPVLREIVWTRTGRELVERKLSDHWFVRREFI